jgi:hypothetical protein
MAKPRGRRRRLRRVGARNLVEVGRGVTFWCTTHDKRFGDEFREEWELGDGR